MDDANLSESTPVDDRSDPTPAEGNAPPSDPVPQGGRRKASERLTFTVPRVPEDTDAWLHVVSGPSAAAVARGAVDLAGRFLAGAHRVLIIDGGPRLQLHDRFAGEARWGVIECLTGDMPVLGLVQETGRLDLYMLAHGLPAPRTPWDHLGRILDEARPHFGRAAIGEALAGWHLEGWWAGGGRTGRRAVKMADRLGIHFSDLDLAATPEARLEALDARLGRSDADAEPILTDDATVPEALLAPASDSSAADPAPLTLEVPEAALAHAEEEAIADAGEAATAAPAPPVVLECDLQVRERLRFLLWMRRIQSDELRAEITRPARAPGGAPSRS
jgi:hypothetical protein